MGGVYRIQTFLDFNIFLIFTRPLSQHTREYWSKNQLHLCTSTANLHRVLLTRAPSHIYGKASSFVGDNMIQKT